MRGFYSGVFWGLVVSGLGVAVMSVLTPLAPPPDIAQITPDTGQAQDMGAAATQSAVTQPDPAMVETARTAPVAPDPAPDTVNDRVSMAMASTGRPEVGDTARQPASPAGAEGEAGVRSTASGTAALMSNPVTKPPAAPVRDSVAALPPAVAGGHGSAQVTAPQAFGIAAEMGATDPPQIKAPSDPSPAGTDQIAAMPPPQIETAPVAATASGGRPEGNPVVQGAARSDNAAAEPSEVTTPAGGTEGDTPEPSVIVPREPEPPVESGAVSAPPPIAALPQAGIDDSAPRPSVGKRVVPLTERQPIGKEDALAEPPLRQFATPFDVAADKPLMAIVLIDDGDADGVDTLAAFPYPVSIAIDPAAPDAVERMARHRSAGFEVISLVDLPRGASAQDAEVSLSAGFDRLTEAVGVLEGPDTGLQGNRNLSGQVVDFAKNTGRGVVMRASGLNTAYKLALRDRVPAALVFRDFDGAGQSPDVMRRFLDQAALRAGQDGTVVMMGRLRPETVRALIAWGLQDRGARVALAPVSAVLMRSVAEAAITD